MRVAQLFFGVMTVQFWFEPMLGLKNGSLECLYSPEPFVQWYW
jgi:hypothetical protein